MIKRYYKNFEIYKNKNGITGVLYCRDEEKKDWYEIIENEKIGDDEIAVLIYKNEIVDITKDLSTLFPSNVFEVIILKGKYKWLKRNIIIEIKNNDIYFIKDLEVERL